MVITPQHDKRMRPQSPRGAPQVRARQRRQAPIPRSFVCPDRNPWRWQAPVMASCPATRGVTVSPIRAAGKRRYPALAEITKEIRFAAPAAGASARGSAAPAIRRCEARHGSRTRSPAAKSS